MTTTTEGDTFWARLPARLVRAAEAMSREYAIMQVKHRDHAVDGAASTDFDRLATLVEEAGEVARTFTYDAEAGKRRQELLQLANVALTWASLLEER